MNFTVDTERVRARLRTVSALASALAITAAGIATLSGRLEAARPPAKLSIGKLLLARVQALRSYEATIRTQVVLQPINDSQPNTIGTTMQLYYKAPNLLRIDTKGLVGGGTSVSNGKTMITYSALTNQYSESPAPASVTSEIMGSLHSAPDVERVGRTRIGDIPVIEYKGVGPADQGMPEFEAFLNAATGLPQRIVVHMTKLPGPQGAQFHMTLTEDYVAQKLNPVLPAHLFVFHPPAGAQRTQATQFPSMMGLPGALGQ